MLEPGVFCLGLFWVMPGPSWAYLRPMLGNFWARFFALKIP
jgi:hypothetical protein